MASRDLNHLRPDVKEKCEAFLARAKAMGIDVIITCTYRSNEEQADAYAQGRTVKGKIITYALPGESKHNKVDEAGNPASEAFDFVPLAGGKCVWNASSPVYKVLGSIGESLGLKWAGNWKRFKEYVHFEV